MLLRSLLLVATACTFAACGRSLPKYEKPVARAQYQRIRTTAYTHTESDHIEHGCRTALGTTLRCGQIKSAASDWSRWPSGTVFRIIDTNEIYEVDDMGWALSGRNTIDLYKPSKSAMNAWGVRMVDIEILKWGDDRRNLALLEKRSKHKHVRRMLADLEDRVDAGKQNPPLAPTPANIAFNTQSDQLTASTPAYTSPAPTAAPVPARSSYPVYPAATPAVSSSAGGLRQRRDF